MSDGIRKYETHFQRNVKTFGDYVVLRKTDDKEAELQDCVKAIMELMGSVQKMIQQDSYRYTPLTGKIVIKDRDSQFFTVEIVGEWVTKEGTEEEKDE